MSEIVETVSWHPPVRHVATPIESQKSALSKGLLLLSEFTKYAPDLKGKTAPELARYVSVYLELLGPNESSDILAGCKDYARRMAEFPKSPVDLKPYVRHARERRQMAENEGRSAIEAAASIPDEEWQEVLKIRRERFEKLKQQEAAQNDK